MILCHSYVPANFGFGTIVPIVKDIHADCSSLDNYRPITLSPVISKLFESVLLQMYSDYLISDSLQFGFKKNIGCSNAIFLLRNVIEYFNNNGSNVYVASLDASRAFDKLNHFKLFSVLYKRGLPVILINVIINWSRLVSTVRWEGTDSSCFDVKSVVRQGEFYPLSCLIYMLIALFVIYENLTMDAIFVKLI
jgi:hypothetical protein